MKIDLHTHILPPGWPAMQVDCGYDGWPTLTACDAESADIMLDGRLFRRIQRNCWDAERRIAECDRRGIDVQVLSTVPVMFSYWAKPQDTLRLAQYLNDHIAEVARARPDRFIGLGTVPLQSPDLAIGELERCMRDLGMRGVEIATHANGCNLDEPVMFPFFERAAQLGAAVFVHPWDMMARERMPRYFLPWLVGMPAETSLAICSVIFGGVLERLPSLRICFAHGGGAFPMTVGRIDHAYDARPDLTRVHLSRRPRDFVRDIYVDSLVHDAPTLRFIIDLFGADRVALGSDYPFPLGENEAGKLIASLDLDTVTLERLHSGTACAFLGLDVGAAPHPSTAGRG